MANPDGRIPNISLNDCVLGLTGEESVIGLQPVTLRASTDSLRRSEVVSNIGLAGEEGFIGMHRLRASTNSLRRPGVYTNQAYDNYLACEDYEPENQYEDLASVVAKQNAPRKKTNDVYESTSRSPERRRKQNELYESSVLPPKAIKPRSRNVTECSDVSLSSLQSYFEPSPRQSCLHNLILFLVLIFSTAAFVLVILQLFGIVGMQCGCNKSNEVDRGGRSDRLEGTDASKAKTQTELIQELKENLTRLQKTMDTRDKEHQLKEEQHKNDTDNEIARVSAMVVNLTSWMPPTDGSAELKSKISAIKDDVNFTQHQVEVVNSTQRKYANETQTKVRQIEEGEINLSHDVSKLKNKTREHELFLQSSVHDLQKNLSHRINPVYAKMNNLSQWVSTLKKQVDELKAVKVANFSSCQFIEGETSTNTNTDKFKSRYATASYTEQNGKKVMGTACISTFQPASAELSKVQNKYKCKCTVDAHTPTILFTCKIFVWECSTS